MIKRLFDSWLSPQTHRQIIALTLAVYLLATLSSIAAMEISGWLTCLITLLYVLRRPQGEAVTPKELSSFLPWKTCLALVAVTAIGLWFNGQPGANYRYAMGSQRWTFLFWGLAYAFTLWPPTPRWYRLFAGAISLVAVYALFQTVTGIDLLRPGTHRAVQALDLEMSFPLWRSAGLFASPLQYAYIAGQHVCLALAMVLILAPHRHKYRGLFWLSVVAYLLVSLSIITTFTRGGWLAMIGAHLTIAALVSTRVALSVASTGAAILLTLFSALEPFRVRVLSLFDPTYAANRERVFLWRVNWEMFKDYPLIGIGYQQNEARAREYVTRLGNPDAFTGHAHNNYLQMLSGTGIIGFALYLFLIGFMMWLTLRLWRRLPKDLLWPRALCLAALGAQLHIHLGGFTECNFKAVATNHNLLVFWSFVVAMSWAEAKGLLRSGRFAVLKP